MDKLFDISLLLGCIGIVLMLVSLTFTFVFGFKKQEINDLKSASPFIKLLLGAIMLTGFLLAISLFGFLTYSFLALVKYLKTDFSAQRLIIFSIGLGLLPLLLTSLGAGLAKLLGGEVTAAGAKNCQFLTFNLNPLTHALFMSYFLMFIVGPISFIGCVVGLVMLVV